jgi:hypothetical protein
LNAETRIPEGLQCLVGRVHFSWCCCSHDGDYLRMSPAIFFQESL